MGPGVVLGVGLVSWRRLPLLLQRPLRRLLPLLLRLLPQLRVLRSRRCWWSTTAVILACLSIGSSVTATAGSINHHHLLLLLGCWMLLLLLLLGCWMLHLMVRPLAVAGSTLQGNGSRPCRACCCLVVTRPCRGGHQCCCCPGITACSSHCSTVLLHLLRPQHWAALVAT